MVATGALESEQQAVAAADDQPGFDPAAEVKPGTRLHYLDWIRVLAILGVFLYHASQPFMLEDWLIKDSQQSPVLTFGFMIFLGSFGMPLFFLVAGAGSRFALRRRTGRQFVVERLQRLLLPFVIGCLLLSPIEFYLEWLHKGLYQGSFWSYLPVLLDDRYQTVRQGLSPSLFKSLGIHLWFLGFLLSYSLISLPLFLWLQRAPGRQALAWLARLAGRRGGLFLFAVPVVLARGSLKAQYPGYTDWADFAYMLVFFICGYLLFAERRLTAAVWRDGPLALGAGLLCTAIMLILLFFGPGREWVEAPGTVGFFIAWGMASINGWCWTLFSLWLAGRYFSRSNRWLAYGQSIIVPFYVFHLPFVVAIAFYVVAWPAGLALKLPLIILASFSATLLFVEVVVRRLGPLRVLFGMKA